MEQFKDFPAFVESIVSYGREAGLVKIIPPKDWTSALPDLSERLASVKVKTPIIQHIRGTKGIYTQTNIESRKSYTVAEFKALSLDSDHRPPSRKGAPHGPADPLPRRKRNRKPVASLQTDTPLPVETDSLPVTPTRTHDLTDATSPSPPSRRSAPQDLLLSLVTDAKEESEAESMPMPRHSHQSKQKDTKPVEQEKIEPPMTDYKIEHGEDYTVDYCKELERNYWRNLTFVQPMYGADMSGSLFDDRTKSWNTQCLGDLLSRIDQNLPGVNTPYLYFGMWKATFAWHVEDMDLYSINYLHFGAPKQWYCIRPEHSARFECIAQGIFSSDYKTCPQFLRHKTYLLSPSKLATDGVPVNRLVQHEGEFVLTFPFAYHSGYNLGFNCAESINFALNDWIPIGRKAESCKCINDSVQIDVEAIFESSKNSGSSSSSSSSSSSMEGTSRSKSRASRKSSDVEMKEENSSEEINESAQRKRRRGGGGATTKDQEMEETRMTETTTTTTSTSRSRNCYLCPTQDYDGEMLPTNNGKHCHMICAQYIPETYMSGEEDDDVIVHVDGVPAARRKLRCFLCEKKTGGCVQCCKGKCIRAVHASCADKAGLYVEEVVQSDGESIEYQVYCPTHDPVSHVPSLSLHGTFLLYACMQGVCFRKIVLTNFLILFFCVHKSAAGKGKGDRIQDMERNDEQEIEIRIIDMGTMER
ncbi:putative jumonji family transcription factor [Dissophora ornata]|nr:putative jumonji family transcription factor [Dissophora ornata]